MECSAEKVIEFIEHFNIENNAFYEKTIKSLSSVKQNDNPIFIIGKLKNK